MKNLIYQTSFLILLTGSAHGQETRVSASQDTAQKITMAAGEQFAASRSKQFWWGKHWRKEWMQPVSLSILHLDTIAGGLTPLKKGGGHETKTLRLMGRDEKEYVLRTIDKSLDALIPEELKGTFINDIVNDQISTAHPYGPLVVASLAGSIGILHTNPVIGFVPDSPILDSFRNDFANKLCLFEERPSGSGWANTAQSNFGDDVINSEKLFQKLIQDNKRKVDQKEYLKVRLFDMVINDWDRHDDQWIWVEHKNEKNTIYTPFARDRDQSFSRTDGLNLFLLSRPWALRALQNMDPTIRDVIGANLSATFLDKAFLTELTEEDWRNTIEQLQQLLTDSVIKKSLQTLPPPVFDMSSDFLYRRLQQRRDNMYSYAMRYYKKLNKEVTITGSEKKELFIINKIAARKTEIIIRGLNKDNEPGNILYRREFDHAITKEINLYGLSDNDQFVYTGKSRNKITIRVIGGEGTDLYTDSTVERGSGKKTRVYDSPEDKPASAKATRYTSASDTSLVNYHQKSFKYDWWIPLIIPGINPDDGFVIEAGFIYKKRQWNKNPYGWQQKIGGSYAASTGAYSFFYAGKFKHVFGKWDLGADARYDAPGYVVNFYGYGNDTKLTTMSKNFYRVRATSLFLSPSLSHSWKNNVLSMGLTFNSVKVEPNAGKFITQSGSMIDPSVFRTKYFGGINASYSVSTKNHDNFPTKGILYEIGSAYWINLQQSKRDFVNLESSFSFYYSPFKKITIAHRTGGSVNSGDYEFYQANTIGGSENLRGYWRTRFTGKTSFYQNTDLRVQLTRLKGYILRGTLGIYGFFDDGRVWTKKDASDQLHYGYGGGVFLVPYNILAINLSYAMSKEVNVFTFRVGFLF